MTFVCQNCGVKSDMVRDLCRPVDDELEENFCGDNALGVCDDNISSMKYNFEACNSVSANPENLCNTGKL